MENALNKLMEVTIPDPPQYKTGMSMSYFLRQVEEYEVLWKRHKYSIAITFINYWLANYKMNIKSLLEFKKISEEILNKDEKYNKRLVKQHISNINKAFTLNYIIKKKKTEEEIIKSGKNFWDETEEGEDNQEDEDIDTDDVEEMEIIKIIRLMLEKIEYILVRNIINKKSYYTIKMKK
jgi:hypothetical protein